jgi:hypothetical protein
MVSEGDRILGYQPSLAFSPADRHCPVAAIPTVLAGAHSDRSQQFPPITVCRFRQTRAYIDRYGALASHTVISL